MNFSSIRNENLTPEADLFAYKLDYETAGFYDGNIGKETWKSAKNTGANRSYDYTYDPAKRLKTATYSGGMFINENYNIENISYDKNGNIQTFWRKGMTAQNGTTPTGFDYVDKMQYFYSGNRLDGITDAVTINLDVSDFRDNGSNSDYTYHPDGSLKSDGNRNISLIEWSTFLRKPKQITYVNGDWIKHFYDGSGRRFKTTDSEGTDWEYVDDLIYKNGVLYQINDDEGRVLYEGGNYVYEFNYKDHLGNTKVSFKVVGNQLIETQENAYYPFGLAHTGTDFTLGVNANNFQYNGKEKINSFGLNYSDYGFRTVDLLTNRFISVDPLAEKFPELTTYQYASNNPVLNIDLDGLEGMPYYFNPQSELNKISNNIYQTYNKAMNKIENVIGSKASATQSFTGQAFDWLGIKPAKIYGNGSGREDLGVAYDTKSSSVFDLGREKEFSTFLSVLSISGGGANTPGKFNLREFMNAGDAVKALIDVYGDKEFINVESTGLLFNPDYKLPSGVFFIENYNNPNGAKWNMVGVHKNGKVKMDNKVYFAFYENSQDGKKVLSGTMTFQQLIDLAKNNSK